MTPENLETTIREALTRLGVKRKPVLYPVVPADVNVVDSRDAAGKEKS